MDVGLITRAMPPGSGASGAVRDGTREGRPALLRLRTRVSDVSRRQTMSDNDTVPGGPEPMPPLPDPTVPEPQPPAQDPPQTDPADDPPPPIVGAERRIGPESDG